MLLSGYHAGQMIYIAYVLLVLIIFKYALFKTNQKHFYFITTYQRLKFVVKWYLISADLDQFLNQHKLF